jgi:transcriptional regulator GlxA family with amidase domain
MKRTVGILLFENAEELDFVGPWQVFSTLHAVRPDLCDVVTVSERGGQITCAKGLRVVVDHSFQTCPNLNMLIIPGGHGRKQEVNNPVVIEFIQKIAKSAELMTSVCTGAFLLQRAGLLQGKRATTYWSAIEELKSLGVDVVSQRWVDQGNVITAAGVSAGIDMSLYVVGKLWGPAAARKLQKGMEYFPQPPYQDVPIPD